MSDMLFWKTSKHKDSDESTCACDAASTDSESVFDSQPRINLCLLHIWSCSNTEIHEQTHIHRHTQTYYTRIQKYYLVFFHDCVRSLYGLALSFLSSVIFMYSHAKNRQCAQCPCSTPQETSFVFSCCHQLSSKHEQGIVYSIVQNSIVYQVLQVLFTIIWPLASFVCIVYRYSQPYIHLI